MTLGISGYGGRRGPRGIGEGVAKLRELIKGALDTLTGVFDRVGIWKNLGKIVGMLCFPCCAVGT